MSFGILLWSLSASAQSHCVESRGGPAEGALLDLAMVEPGAGGETLVAVTEDVIVRSSDGGVSWLPVTALDAGIETEETFLHLHLHPHIEARGALVTVVREEQLLVSDDRGLHFERLMLPISDPALDIAIGEQGERLFVAHDGAIAVLELSSEGVHLIAEVQLSGPVTRVASSEGGTVIVTSEGVRQLLVSEDGTIWLEEPMSISVGTEVVDICIGPFGDMTFLTMSGIYHLDDDDGSVRLVERWPGLGHPAAITRGRGEELYLTDRGELYVIDFGCRNVVAQVAFAEPSQRRLRGRVVRGGAPALSFELGLGPGSFDMGVILTWSWPMVDFWEEQRWMELQEDLEDARQRQDILSASLFSSPSVEADLERAVRVMRARNEQEIIEMTQP